MSEQDTPPPIAPPVDAAALDAPPPVPPSPLGPVGETERIAALDVLRGFAIFGIFTANIVHFAEPLIAGLQPTGLAEGPLADKLAWAAVKTFSEYKFMSLFSLLFGMGLVVQMMRAERRGRDIVPVYVRRLILLALIGLAHVLFLWYGDILFMYAMAGFALLVCRKMNPRALLALSAALLIGGGAMLSGIMALSFWGAEYQQRRADSTPTLVETPGDAGEPSGHEAPSDPESAEDAHAADSEAEPSTDGAPEAAAATGSADDRWQRWVAEVSDMRGGPESDEFSRAETIAYKEGPFLAAMLMRTMTWGMGLIFSFGLSGMALRVLGLFLLGAALMKLDFFDASWRRWHWTLFIGGILIGLPLEAFVAASYWRTDFEIGWSMLGPETLHYFSSLVLFLGYAGGVTLLATSGILRHLTAGLACVGRMALTNYLLQSVIAGSIMYWWGLGLFGEVPRPMQLGLVVAIFAGQIVLSALWLRFFTMGPMEWLWRSATYLKLQPIRRSSVILAQAATR